MKRLAKKLKRKLLKIAKQWVKYWALNRLLPRAYAKAAQAPVAPDKVVFVENKQADLSDSYKVIYERLTHDYTFDVRFVSLGQNRVRFKKYFRNCEAMLQEIATAKYVFLNDASDVVSCVDLRPETKVVQLWHACGAFKKWGMSTADLIFGGSRKDLLRHPFYKNLSLVTVSSPEVEWAYREAMVLEDRPQVVQPLGVSRTDLFFDSDYLAGMRERIEQLVPECAGKKIILYAPTFRGRVAKAEGPGQLNIRAMKQALGDEYVLMIKHHPFVKNLPPIPDDCQDFAFQMSGGIAAIDQLLTVADVCISDYSSLVFEYSLFERPMIFFAYDLADYGDWRGFYYDYDQLTPGPVLTDTAQIIDYVQHLDVRFDKQEVVNFKQRFMSACDGHATDRICQAVFGEDLQVYRRPTTAEVLRAQNPDGKDISIIIPAYNAMPFIKRTIDSVLSQTYPLERMELIIVDDCSSDDTYACMKQYEADYPELVTCLQMGRNSGSCAAPRDKGMDKAMGTYLYFLDADDWLGDHAVEKMLHHAEDWHSDVLLTKMKGEGGREVPKAMFKGNQPSVNVYTSKVMWSFSALKLFNRSFVEEHQWRFGTFMPEDIPFVLRAYCEAKIVSVAADYDYYHVFGRPDEGNYTSSIWDNFDENMRMLKDVFGYVEMCVTDADRNPVLMRRLFRRDIFFMLKRLAEQNNVQARQSYDEVVRVCKRYYVSDMYLTCPIDIRLVLDAAFFCGFECLSKVVAAIDTSEADFLKGCIYSIADNRVICALPETTASLTCDITDSIATKCRVEKIRCNDTSMVWSGSLASSIALSRLRSQAVTELVAENENGIGLAVWPCSVVWKDIEKAGDAFSGYAIDATAIWSAETDLAAICRALADIEDIQKDLSKGQTAKCFLYLRQTAEEFSTKVRVGASSSVSAIVGFSSTTIVLGGFKLKPYRTECGNFGFRVKGLK